MFTYPLCFRYTGSVIGTGFLSSVDLQGRVLAVVESDGVWLYGVNPGAIAVGDKTLDDANRAMRDAMTKVFIDFAQEAGDFEAFKSRLEAFYGETDQESSATWESAVEAIKSGAVMAPDRIKRCPDPSLFVRVTQKTTAQLTPEDNPLVLRDAQPDLSSAA